MNQPISMFQLVGVYYYFRSTIFFGFALKPASAALPGQASAYDSAGVRLPLRVVRALEGVTLLNLSDSQ